MFGYLLGMLQHGVIAQGFGCPGSWNSLESDLLELKKHLLEMIKPIILAYYIINKIGAQSYLSPETGSDEGPSATGASPAAHGVSHCLLVVLGCEDSMQRCLERTWQT